MFDPPVKDLLFDPPVKDVVFDPPIKDVVFVPPVKVPSVLFCVKYYKASGYDY